MYNIAPLLQALVGEVGQCLMRIDEASVMRALDELEAAPRVFCAGAGRSGLAARAFAMRLMHMGRDAYVVGETVTPGIGAGELLVVCSGSGRTESLLAASHKAKEAGARVLLFTIDENSPVAEISDFVVKIPAPSPKALHGGEAGSVQPLGSLFEQALFLLLDSMVVLLMGRYGLTGDEMFLNHANLE